jgi:hypothetical protein
VTPSPAPLPPDAGNTAGTPRTSIRLFGAMAALAAALLTAGTVASRAR